MNRRSVSLAEPRIEGNAARRSRAGAPPERDLDATPHETDSLGMRGSRLLERRGLAVGAPFLALILAVLAAGCASGARETASPASGSLTNTYWKLTELDGRAVLASPNRREPHLRLMADGTRVAGSTGCNNILGRYEQDGDRIRFSALATTRMACLDEEANRQEGAFVEALGQVDRFMVSGDALTLFQGERPRARFAAVYLR
jgi:heat shock protein HslJ